MRRFLLTAAVLGGLGFLLYKGYLYFQVRHLLPAAATIGGVSVAGLSEADARHRVLEVYSRPLVLLHNSERVEIEPAQVGFMIDLDAMMAEAGRQRRQQGEWLAYLGFLGGNPIRRIEVPLQATHSREAVLTALESVAAFLDQPARPGQIAATSLSMQLSQAGFVTNVMASLPAVEQALYRPANRVAPLIIENQDAAEAGLDMLRSFIEARLRTFDGLGSIFLMDLETGEEIGINADVALSGLSILKIAIFVEAYRALDHPPSDYQQEIFVDTAARSSNFGANLLLHIVAGEENTYRGADILTGSMRSLGLVNTFIAVPYDATPPSHRQTTYVTPANSRTDINVQPDPTIQTTAEEIGTLLSMIYYCSKGGGALLARYPDQLTPEECQAIIDLMILNEEGNLIRFGVPAGTPVSHKHGWALGTHADAGIVLSEGGDYVLVEFLNRPGDWLQADESFPILRDLSRVVFNYFNPDQPYLDEHHLIEQPVPFLLEGDQSRGR